MPICKNQNMAGPSAVFETGRGTFVDDDVGVSMCVRWISILIAISAHSTSRHMTSQTGRSQVNQGRQSSTIITRGRLRLVLFGGRPEQDVTEGCTQQGCKSGGDVGKLLHDLPNVVMSAQDLWSRLKHDIDQSGPTLLSLSLPPEHARQDSKRISTLGRKRALFQK